MDDVDRTQERMERDALLMGQAKRAPSLVPTGTCYNCDEPVEEGRLFCPGPECRDDYDYRKRLEKRPA